MATRSTRVVRGLIVAAISLLVAAGAHASVGGQMGAVGFAIALAFSCLASIALSGRPASLVRTTAAVVFSQGIFHLLFGIGAGPSAAGIARPAAMVMAGMGASPLRVGESVATTQMPYDGWMWAAHGVAAVITVVALIRGEKAFWRLAEWVYFALKPAIPSFRPSTTPRRVFRPLTVLTRMPSSEYLLSAPHRRGPPTTFDVS